MNLPVIAARARSAATPFARWALGRARERSTWLGLAAVAGAVGKSVWADHLTSLGDVVPMLLAGGGAVAIGATTSTPAQPPT